MLKAFVSTLLILSAALTTACNQVDEDTKQLSSPVKKLKGASYYLSTIEYADGKISRPEKDEFTFMIESDDSIVGKIACNTFRAELSWETDNVVFIESLNKTDSTCTKPDVLNFEYRMSYELLGSRIIFTQQLNKWRATFVKVKEN